MLQSLNKAQISSCGKYRYSFASRVDDLNDKVLHFIMLNPSTADSNQDDATIRKCKGFCTRLGYSLLQVTNLFDYRATNPDELKKASYPYSEHAVQVVRNGCLNANKTICGWGTKGTLFHRAETVLAELKDFDLYALDMTKDGHPKHPLYIAYGKEPVIFRKKAVDT